MYFDAAAVQSCPGIWNIRTIPRRDGLVVRKWRCGQRFSHFIIQLLNLGHGCHHQLCAVLNFNDVLQLLGQTGNIESNKQKRMFFIKTQRFFSTMVGDHLFPMLVFIIES